MNYYNVALKFSDGSVKTVSVKALDIFIAWHQAVSLYGGVVTDGMVVPQRVN